VNHSAREHVDYFQRVIAKGGNKQSLAFGIRGKVINSASHARNGNLFFQLQRKDISRCILSYTILELR
jgi:hypothetical protein